MLVARLNADVKRDRPKEDSRRMEGARNRSGRRFAHVMEIFRAGQPILIEMVETLPAW